MRRLADARALFARYNLTVDDAIHRALNDSRNLSCKPGDPAVEFLRIDARCREGRELASAASIKLQ
jgi:hydroxypyruvate reductase